MSRTKWLIKHIYFGIRFAFEEVGVYRKSIYEDTWYRKITNHCATREYLNSKVAEELYATTYVKALAEADATRELDKLKATLT